MKFLRFLFQITNSAIAPIFYLCAISFLFANDLSAATHQDSDGDCYGALVANAISGRWHQLQVLLVNPQVRLLESSAQTAKVITAIKWLVEFHTSPAESDGADDKDEMLGFIRIVDMANHELKQKNKKPSHMPSIDDRISSYLGCSGSRIILSLREFFGHESEQKLACALRTQAERLGRWPDKDSLSTLEQFFWNLVIDRDHLYKEDQMKLIGVFGSSKPLNWDAFQDFCKPYVDAVIHRLGPYGERAKKVMIQLLPVYQAFPKEEEFRDFKAFFLPYVQMIPPQECPNRMNELLRVYQAFPEKNDRDRLMEGCERLCTSLNSTYPSFDMRNYASEVMVSLARVMCASDQNTDQVDELITFIKRLNFKHLSPDGAVSYFCAFPDAHCRDKFIEFRNSLLFDPNYGDCSVNLKTQHLRTIYEAFPDDRERKEFLNSYGCIKDVRILTMMVPVYRFSCDRAFSDEMLGIATNEKLYQRSALINTLVQLYRKYGKDGLRNFRRVHSDVYGKVTREEETSVHAKMGTLLCDSVPVQKNTEEMRIMDASHFSGIYDVLENEELANFVEFCVYCNTFDADKAEKYVSQFMSNLLPYYQSLLDTKRMVAFKAFCSNLIHAGEGLGCKDVIKILGIFLHNQTDFERFMEKHSRFIANSQENRRLRSTIMDLYIKQEHLRIMRAAAALQAEEKHQEARIWAMYREINLSDQLPVLCINDPLLKEYKRRTIVNVHEYDDAYELDFSILKSWCADKGYSHSLSPTPHRIYNGQKSINPHYTNGEVEDFISYLDETIAYGPPLKLDKVTIPAVRVVSLVKQIIGLEEKSDGTTGSFPPCLGHPMFYAKPSSAKGDEILGMAWYMMKEIGAFKHQADSKENPDDYKRSVVLAILEAADEISQDRAVTHCQTRTTGELMKCIAHHLPGSHLKKHIAIDDGQLAANDGDKRTRIAGALMRAEILFNKIKSGYGPSVTARWAHHIEQDTKPGLWELYEAYYDDLYRRSKDANGNYVNNDNTLVRDAHGNLVKGYLADGTRNPNPEIVYYQAEFQVLEHAFTEHMRKEFEEQRGLVY